MPRQMPPFGKWFCQRVQEALALARAGDLANSRLRGEWHISRVELLYELAYLRMFTEWELFLEQTFIGYLRGYASTLGVVRPLSGTFLPTLAKARAAVLSGRPFVSWHNPNPVISRAIQFFVKGSPHESVIASNSGRLMSLAAVRHRIAHGQEDVRQKFDAATMSLAGRRYRGARPGRFLRDWDISVSPHKRWLETLGIELGNLALQIA